jgi:hypothetical protein
LGFGDLPRSNGVSGFATGQKIHGGSCSHHNQEQDRSSGAPSFQKPLRVIWPTVAKGASEVNAARVRFLVDAPRSAGLD